MAGPGLRCRTITSQEWNSTGRARQDGSFRCYRTCWRDKSSRVFSTMSICHTCRLKPMTRKWSGVRLIRTPCRSTIGTKKKAVSIMQEIITCVIEHPGRTSTSAGEGASPSPPFAYSDCRINVLAYVNHV